MVLQFMSLKTGGAHPLTREADLQLDTDLPSTSSTCGRTSSRSRSCSCSLTSSAVLPFHLPSARAADALPLVAT
jgi:hypothetical protein